MLRHYARRYFVCALAAGAAPAESVHVVPSSAACAIMMPYAASQISRMRCRCAPVHDAAAKMRLAAFALLVAIIVFYISSAYAAYEPCFIYLSFDAIWLDMPRFFFTERLMRACAARIYCRQRAFLPSECRRYVPPAACFARHRCAPARRCCCDTPSLPMMLLPARFRC